MSWQGAKNQPGHAVNPLVKKPLFLLVSVYSVNQCGKLDAISWNYRKICIHLCFVPLILLIIDILLDNLGSNAQQALHIRLGDWALRFLCITLLITPIQKVTKWRGLAEYRQLFGLFCFLYATLHLIGYLFLDHAAMWKMIFIDIVESPYIWFGLFAYLIVFLLGITSSKAAMKMMGKSWKKLHRWVYPASVAVLIHYFWQLKGNLMEPVFYALIIFILLAFRILDWLKDRQLAKLFVPKGRAGDDK